MAKISPESAEVNARIVYWGVQGAGKRTSLANVVTKLRPDHRGSLRSVPTPLDPAVSYTVLPIELGDIGGIRTRIEMVAVPGGPEQAPTRKQLLDQVDGIVFVVDSRRERIEENVASLEELRKALADYARSLEQIPLVIQYNRRDLSDPYVLETLHRRLGLRSATVFEAVATEGTGLLQTLSTISKKVIRALREPQPEASAAPLAPPVRARPESAPARPRPAEPHTRVDAPAPARPAPPPAEISMEEAILAEGGHADAAEIEAKTRAAESLMQQSWSQAPDQLEASIGARIDAGLSIVSVGPAVRADARSLRIPLVLGDGEGATSTVVLTIRIDPLIEETPD